MENLTLQKWLGTDDKACADIVKKKYLISEDILGHQETIDEFLDRVSMGDEQIRSLIEQRKFIPGGRLLAGIGLDKYGIKASYSNCYVMEPPKDSIKSIYKTCGEEGETYSRGGGCGMDISNLAPRNAKVNNTAKVSSGAVSFMPTFSQVAEQIGQNGRRGALLISIKDTHPDLLEFITHKRDLNMTTHANLSVRISDAFMEAVDKDMDWRLYFDRKETGEHIERIVKARGVMKLLAQTNWEMGEPGMLFWDTFEKYNLMSEDPDFEYAGTNPCGEEPLPAGGACLLGSMNLSAYYDDTINDFDTGSFKHDVRVAIKYLDDVLEKGIDLHVLRYQKDAARNYRQIGLGVMGLADLFIKKRIQYGSLDSVNFVNMIGYMMVFEAVRASCDLAIVRGSFPLCKPKYILESNFIDYNIKQNPYYIDCDIQRLLKDIENYGLRNSALLTCAPTGTTSTIFNVSNGIEPLFSLEYERTTKTVYDKETKYIVHPSSIQSWLKDNNYTSIHDVENIPEYFVTARDINWVHRINVQSALQSHIDASISSTINLPESATAEDIERLYKYAYIKKCKGITVFRENCSRDPILKDTTKREIVETAIQECDKSNKNDRVYTNETVDNSLKEAKSVDVTFTVKNPKDFLTEEQYKELEKVTLDTMCPSFSAKPLCSENKILTRKDFGHKLASTTYYERVACGHIYITISNYNGHIVEVFMNSCKSGGCAANISALGRLASTLLRSRVDINTVIDSTIGIKCDACVKLKGKGEKLSGLSCSDVMARVIREEYEHLSKSSNKERSQIETVQMPNLITPDSSDKMIVAEYNYSDHTVQENIDNGICPECGKKLVKTGGCVTCTNCGFSLCS